METPYKVKGNFYPIITYDDTEILAFNQFGIFKAKQICKLLNTAFVEGHISTCMNNDIEIEHELVKRLLK